MGNTDILNRLSEELTAYLPYVVRVNSKEDIYSIESLRLEEMEVLYEGSSIDCKIFMENMKKRIYEHNRVHYIIKEAKKKYKKGL